MLNGVCVCHGWSDLERIHTQIQSFNKILYDFEYVHIYDIFMESV